MLTMARGMMKAKAVQAWLWWEAVMTAVFLLNHAPTRNLVGHTSYEKPGSQGDKLAMHLLRVFGCVAHSMSPNQTSGSLMTGAGRW